MQLSVSVFVFLLFCEANSIYADATAPLPNVTNDQHRWNKAIQCQTDEECQTYIKDSICKNECKCPPDKLLSSDASKCLKTAEEYGSPCENDVQCSGVLSSGGACVNGICKCKSGYHYLNGGCWKNIDLNEKCHKDEQCFSAYEYIGLKCEGTCKCRPEYYQRLNSGCRRIRRSGETCNLDSDCIGDLTCERMKCTGSSSVHTTEDDEERHKIQLNYSKLPELGTTCEKDEDCPIKNSICLDKTICGCKPLQYVASEDNRKCLQVPLGKVENIGKSSCTENAQCGVYGGNSVCQNKKCSCKDGTYWETEEKFCWTIKRLNEKCSVNKDCNPSGDHAECVGNICKCQRGYHEKNEICVPDALKVGDGCEEDDECLFPNSFCDSSDTCACKNHYYVENGKCVPGVGSTCQTQENCAHLNNTICELKTKQCLCLKNHTNSNDDRYCLPISEHKEECQEAFQCQFLLGELSECKNGTCECVEKAHYTRGKCYNSKFLGEPCAKKLDCFPGNDPNSVFCLKGICSCQFDYSPDGNKICVKTNSGTVLKIHPILLTSLVFVFMLKR